MALIKFIESSIKIDVSDVAVGSGGTYDIILTKDQRQAFSNTGLTVTICDETDTPIVSNPPYSAAITAIDSNYYRLRLTFDKPVHDINFGFDRKLTISNGGTDTAFDMRVECNYTSSYDYITWSTNSTENDRLISEITLKSSLVSINANTIFRHLLNSAINARNKILNYIDKYYYNKYLSDVIDFALAAGTGLEGNTGLITRDSDGDIQTVKTTFTNVSRRNKTLITYNYTTGTKLRLDDTGVTTLETTTIKVLDSIVVTCLDGSDNLLFNVGTISFTRTVLIQTIPLALTNYKKYSWPMITGWTVTV